MASYQPIQKRLLYCLSLFSFLLFSIAVCAQNSMVTGVVRDKNNKAIGGASVIVKGTSNGVVTDDNGSFSITVPRNAILLVSNVNYVTQEIILNNQTSINVTLQPGNSQMQEVVVIGYGTRQRKDVTGAVSSVGSKDIEKSTSLTPEMALQGRAAGVFVTSGGGDPQSRPTVRIRGVNTFGYAEPLYVVDGVPLYEGGSGVEDGAIGDIRSPINVFTMINPQDIESISVLKDASAAAIYGVRASNGVIIITTKRGRGRPKVDVSAQYGIQNIPMTMPVLNTQQYFDLTREAYANNPEPNSTGGYKTYEEKFGPRYDKSDPLYMGNAPFVDWQNELLNKNAPMQDYSVRLSGGSESTNYFLSAGYTNQESPLKSNHLTRYSVAANIDSKVSKIISTGITLRMVQENALVNTGTDLGTMMSTIPFQPIHDANDPTGYAAVASGTFVPNPDYDPTKLDPGAPYIFSSGPSLIWGPQSRFNAFAFQQLNNNEYELSRAMGNAYLQIEPIPGLKIKGSYGGEFYINLRKQFGAYDAWRFSQTPGNPYAGGNADAVGSYGERQGKTYHIDKELSVNYTHTFAKDHSIDVLLNASDEYSRWSVTDVSGKVDYTNPQYWGIRNQPPFTTGFQGILDELQLIGYTARLSYKYKDKYYLDGTLRHDGASKLAPGHKWDYFPSFAAAWRISSENFFPKTKFINDLKFRGGWGTLGNVQSAGAYKFLSGISTTPDYALGSGNGNGVGAQLQGVSLPDFANTSLGWEKLHTTNIGFDATLLDNKVSLTVEWYDKTTYNIIQSVQPPPNTGIQNPVDLNIGKVRNRGIELQVGYNNKLGPVNFSASANLTTVDNKVLELYNGTPLGGEGGRIEEGYSMFYLWGYKVGGIFQNQAEIDAWRAKYADLLLGQVKGDPSKGYIYKPGDMYFTDVHGNPKLPGELYSTTPDSLINSSDRTFLGKTIPGFYYGFNFDANWKNFDLSVFFQGIGDVKKYNGLRSGMESMSGLANQWSTVLDRWTPKNPSNTIPRAIYNDPTQATRTSSRFVESAAYMRLKNIQLSYSFPKSFLNNARFIQGIKLYVSAVNLFTITKWTGIDPENDLVPPTRQYLFGINASF
ncbi:MAG: hypothetical protein C5B52_15810 [Bacteroidetes bacterium]|nr:MAG: hypothetical protein C5B52_15810 [Bacteroidota bacterium]